MKTTEQIKGEIVNYLTKTSIHIFVKPKTIYKYGKEGHYCEYDYENCTYFKVFKKDEDFYVLENSNGQNTPVTYKMKKIDIDYYINYYGNNSKCVISNNLFLNKKMKSVKNNKYVMSEIDEITKNITK
jgi:hypothetical protein